MALDALARVAQHIREVIRKDSLAGRRELMASGLNSSLSLQKGLCAVHAICNAVASVSRHPIDPSVLGGVLIPELARTYAAVSRTRAEPVCQALRLPKGEPLHEGLDRLIDDLPLPTSLAELGLTSRDLPLAADLATRDRAIANGPMHLNRDEVLRILRAVQGNEMLQRTAPG